MAGSIAATRLSANTTSGFSIIKYTGTGAAATIGHGLSQAPELWVAKKMSGTGDWIIGTTAGALDGNDYQNLNLTTPWNTSSGMWNDTSPTSTVINLGNSNDTNEDGESFICYAWHSVEGYQKISDYLGNANADGVLIYTGFRPAFLITLNYESGDVKLMMDNKRVGYNPDNFILRTNGANVEGLSLIHI